MLKLDHVSFGYGERTILNGINLTIQDGDFLAIIGHNGAGKSTLLKLLNGLLKPTSGDVTVNGQNTRDVKTSALAKQIGFLFQNPDRQICQNSVYDEIALNLRCSGLPEGEITTRCADIIRQFGFRADANPFSLSRGERQRLMLAALMAAKPEILILDEPTTGLDYRECVHIMDLARTLNESGATIIMVSHDMEVVSDYAKRAVVVNHGELIADGSYRSVIRNTKTLQAASLLPPQITELAMRLGEGFEEVYTLKELMSVIREETK